MLYQRAHIIKWFLSLLLIAGVIGSVTAYLIRNPEVIGKTAHPVVIAAGQSAIPLPAEAERSWREHEEKRRQNEIREEGQRQKESH